MSHLLKIAFALMVAFFASNTVAFAQEQDEDEQKDQNATEIKMMNGTEEDVKIAIAIAASPGEAPMIIKIISLKGLNTYEFFSIPRSETIHVAVLPPNANVTELSPIPAELKDKFSPLAIDGVDSCDIVLKGNAEEGFLFTLVE